MSLIESYWMLRNSRVVAFTVFELFRENELGLKLPPPPTHPPTHTHTHTHTHRLGLKRHYSATVKHPTLKIKLRTQKLSILPSELNTWDYILINCIKCNRRHLNCQLDIFLLGCNNACYSNFKVYFFIGKLHSGRTKIGWKRFYFLPFSAFPAALLIRKTLSSGNFAIYFYWRKLHFPINLFNFRKILVCVSIPHGLNKWLF